MPISEGYDLMSAEIETKLQGLENFEVIMANLGLTERHPVPEAVPFPEPDPLGAQACQVEEQRDVATSISESKQDLKRSFLHALHLC